MRLRDAVMLAMLPVLQQQQPRKSPKELVRDAYEFGDEAAWQSGRVDQEMEEARAITPIHGLIASGCRESPAGGHPKGRQHVLKRNHRWNVATGTCDYCQRPPVTRDERRAMNRARRDRGIVSDYLQERAG